MRKEIKIITNFILCIAVGTSLGMCGLPVWATLPLAIFFGLTSYAVFVGDK